MVYQNNNALFHSKTVNTAILNFSFPTDIEERHHKITKWITALKTGTLDQIKETSLHGDFLKDLFQEVLGYRSVIDGGGKAWEIHAEQTISDGGGFADGALGFFTAEEYKQGKVKLQGRIIAPIELKSTKDNLDLPALGRKESAVDQGWRYANYTPDCKWIIISNYREIRIYHTGKTPAYYERFLLLELEELAAFKRFYFILCRENFLPSKNTAQSVSVIDQLLAKSQDAQEAITNQLYEEYKAVRLNLVKHFRFTASPDIINRDRVLIEKAQKTLDRVLFIAFCEDKGLLPAKILSNAHDSKDIYNPQPIWANYKKVFSWVDIGNEDPPIPGYNGGLFQHDVILDEELTVPDPLCSQLKQLTRYDFDTEVSVDILGHIFEQSVTDLEELKAETAGQEYDNKKGKRKTQGVFYTPAWVTQYIAEVAIGGYLNRKEEELRDRFQFNSFSAPETNPQRKTEIKFWETYRDEVLKKTRIIDPACGSGAFLIAAFDYLIRQYERINQALIALGHISTQTSLIDLDKSILSNNLYGVDLLSESVEITKLSLWLKTAAKGKTLTYLDNNIKVGNSIVDDSSIVERAFDWQSEFPQIFAEGGFDVVIGNPPYVRQKLFSALKPYLQKNYKSYHGMADLYTYFYEKGLNILKSGGILSYIVANKWLKSGYGEPLRNFFAYQSVLEQIIDFGHAPIFEDADTFPCIVTIRKAVENIDKDIRPEIIVKPEPYSSVNICSVPRDKLANINLAQYLKENSSKIKWSRFTANAWSLENTEIEELMNKIKQIGINLKDFAGIKPYWGILTGCNEVFLIDEATKNSLVKADIKSSEIIKPFLRGQDIKRWHPQWENRWMIFTRRGIDIDKYPAIKSYLNNYRQQLEPRPKQWDEIKDGKWTGRKTGNYKWYEIQDTIDYWELFEKPKIIYQEIQFHPSYSYDENGYLTNNKAFILPKPDLYILAVLNSPLIWWYNWRYLPHMKDEALNPAGYLMETLPIAPPTEEIRAEVEEIATRLIEITKINREANKDVLEWLQITYKIEKLGQKLENFASLELNELVEEVRKRMRKTKSSDPLSPATLKALKEAYNEYAPAIQIRRAEAIKLEHRLSDLVNQAYKLTPEEIDLMWKTAPPRMPISQQSN